MRRKETTHRHRETTSRLKELMHRHRATLHRKEETSSRKVATRDDCRTLIALDFWPYIDMIVFDHMLISPRSRAFGLAAACPADRD